MHSVPVRLLEQLLANQHDALLQRSLPHLEREAAQLRESFTIDGTWQEGDDEHARADCLAMESICKAILEIRK